MSRDDVLTRGRASAEAGMTDACTIWRITGGSTDPITGYPAPSHTYVYTGKCRVQQRPGLARVREVGEDAVSVVKFEIQLPISGSEGIAVYDEVAITSCLRDADLVGRLFEVSELAHKSEATARRITAIERTGS